MLFVATERGCPARSAVIASASMPPCGDCGMFHDRNRVAGQVILRDAAEARAVGQSQ